MKTSIRSCVNRGKEIPCEACKSCTIELVPTKKTRALISGLLSKKTLSTLYCYLDTGGRYHVHDVDPTPGTWVVLVRVPSCWSGEVVHPSYRHNGEMYRLRWEIRLHRHGYYLSVSDANDGVGEITYSSTMMQVLKFIARHPFDQTNVIELAATAKEDRDARYAAEVRAQELEVIIARVSDSVQAARKKGRLSKLGQELLEILGLNQEAADNTD